MTRRQEDHGSLEYLIRFMAGMLGKVIARQEGERAFELIEKARLLAKEYRKDEQEAKAAELGKLVAGLPLEDLNIMIKSFTNYFGMANLAEKIKAHETQVSLPESEKPLRRAVAALKATG